MEIRRVKCSRPKKPDMGRFRVDPWAFHQPVRFAPLLGAAVGYTWMWQDADTGEQYWPNDRDLEFEERWLLQQRVKELENAGSGETSPRLQQAAALIREAADVLDPGGFAP